MDAERHPQPAPDKAPADSIRPFAASGFSPRARSCFERIDWNAPTGAAHIAGFNDQPSWAESGERCWLSHFDAAIDRHELANGKAIVSQDECRPHLAALRYGAWRKDPATFLANLHQALAICREPDLLDIPAMPSLWGRKSGWVGTRHYRPGRPRRAPRHGALFPCLNNDPPVRCFKLKCVNMPDWDNSAILNRTLPP